MPHWLQVLLVVTFVASIVQRLITGYDGDTLREKPSYRVEGNGGILYTIRGGTPSYTHENKRGDVVAKTDGSGAITFQNQYDAHGNPIATTGSTQDRQKANSQDDDPTGLTCYQNRYLDRGAGVWLTRDPAGMIDGPNLYCYVKQNPWTNFDVNGLESYGTYEEATQHGFMGQVWAQPNGQYYPVTLGNVPTVFGQNAKTYAPQITTIAVGSVAVVAAPEVSIPARIAYGGLTGAAAANAGNEVHNAQTGQPVGTNAAKVTLEGAATGAVAQGAAEVIAPEAATAINAQNKAAASSVVPTKSAAATTETTHQAVDYTPISDSPSVGPGKDFTTSQKAKFKQLNAEQNGGTMKSDISGEPLVPPQQSKAGVTPPDNEAHVDHYYPKAEGGPNSSANVQVISRKENLEKSDKKP